MATKKSLPDRSFNMLGFRICMVSQVRLWAWSSIRTNFVIRSFSTCAFTITRLWFHTLRVGFIHFRVAHTLRVGWILENFRTMKMHKIENPYSEQRLPILARNWLQMASMMKITCAASGRTLIRFRLNEFLDLFSVKYFLIIKINRPNLSSTLLTDRKNK